jgi:hypothetical protein
MAENFFFHTQPAKKHDFMHKSTLATSFAGGKLCG